MQSSEELPGKEGKTRKNKEILAEKNIAGKKTRKTGKEKQGREKKNKRTNGSISRMYLGGGPQRPGGCLLGGCMSNGAFMRTRQIKQKCATFASLNKTRRTPVKLRRRTAVATTGRILWTHNNNKNNNNNNIIIMIMENLVRSLWGILGENFQKLLPNFSEVAFMWTSPDAAHFGATSLKVASEPPELLRSCSRSPPCGAYGSSLS